MESVGLKSGESADAATVDQALVQGIAWTAVLRWTAQVVSWIGTAIAARLLSPGDYGLVGMAMLAIGLVRMIEDFGMDTVLVQDRTIDGVRQGRLAGLILLAGLVLCASFTALSGVIANFFKEPQVAALVAALSLLCITDALQVVPRALLQRQMRFRSLALLQFLQVLATQATVVTGAYLGWGVWALVFNTLVGSVVVTAVLVAWRPFSVQWPREIRALAMPLLQGWRILASRFAWYAYTNADSMIIGRMLGKEAFGVYSFATTLSSTISLEITSVVNRVVPGVFSTVQHLKDELRRYFLIVTELLSYLALPVSFGIAVIADLVVAIVLGPQWEAVTAPLRILSIYGAFFSCQVLVGHLLLWTGRFRANMWCSILAAVLMPAGFYVGARWGLVGIAWSMVILYPVVNLPAFVIAFRAIRSNGWQWLGSFAPALIACLVMTAAVAAVRAVLPASMSISVYTAACILIGSAAYVGVLLIFFRPRLWRMWEFLKAIRSKEPTAALQASTA
jgi:teichuronic acid exporter